MFLINTLPVTLPVTNGFKVEHYRLNHTVKLVAIVPHYNVVEQQKSDFQHFDHGIYRSFFD